MNRPGKGRPRRRVGPVKKPFKSQTFDVTIDVIGGRGDGVGVHEGKAIYVPFTVPGDRVRVATAGSQGEGIAASVQETLQAGAGRVTPPCPHFGQCGGCSLQHVSADFYQNWKREQVVTALSRRGFEDVPVAPVVAVAPGSRRRVTWTVSQTGAIGFNARASHDVVAADTCLLLCDGLNELRAQLPTLLRRLPGVRQIQATWLDGGADVVLTGPKALGLEQREHIAMFATDVDLVSLSWREDDKSTSQAVAQRTAPRVTISGVSVAFPSAAFLQPSQEGEAALAGCVVDWLQGSRKIADLFAGLGTFSLAILSNIKASVHAVEGEQAMLSALSQGAGRAGLGGRMTTQCRDLFEQPLRPEELDRFDAVVFDPPRAGAREQASVLASAMSIKRIAAVSCNPATFARDMRLLVDGGYRLEKVVPVDQFPYSAHLEVVGLLSRP